SPRGRSRAAVVARDRAGLTAGLAALAAGDPHPHVVTGTAMGRPGKPVFVFSGYGAQRSGMARTLLEEESAFAEAIDDLDGLFAEEADLDLWDLLESGRMPEGPAEIMPVLFAVQIGLARMWQAYGVEPAAVVGHSMGEVAAAVVAGGLTLEDGVKVIVRRSRLMMALVGGGGMAVLGCGVAELTEFAELEPGHTVHPAVLSSPRQTVVTGDTAAIEAVLAWAGAKGWLARQVQAEGAGHSPQVEPLLPELRELLAELKPRDLQIPMYTTALEDVRSLLGGELRLDADYWAANLRNPVRLTDAVAAAGQDGHRTFVEINAHPILSHAVGETLDGSGALVAHSLKRAPKGQETDDTLTFHTQVATLSVNGYALTGPVGGQVIDLPQAPWRHERHWMDGTRRTAGSDVHPLLGAHVELPGEDRHAWQGHVESVPVAVLAEMALAAGRELDATAVHRLVVKRRHAGPGTLSTTLSDDGHVEIHSRTPAGTWVRLATAEVVADGSAVPDLNAGPGTQVEPAVKGSKFFQVHPEVLDRCLRVLCDEVGEPGWLPESVGELRVFGPTHRGGHCQATVVRTDHGVRGAVSLFAPDGALLLSATGIVLTRQDLPVPLVDKMVEAVWSESELPELPEGDGREDGGGRLVVGDAFDWADAENAIRPLLTEGLRNVVLVPPASLQDEPLVLAVTGIARVLTSQRLWIATTGAQSVLPGEPGNPRQGFLRALIRVLAFEQPGLRATLVDHDRDEDLQAELAAGLADSEVAWRGGLRFTARLAAARLPDGKPARVVRRGGAYIITGGYGGIGLVTARLLADRGAGRVVLSGRSGPGTDAEKAIAKLRESGVDVGVVLGDIAEAGVAERLVRVAEEGGRRLCGIVHGAAGMADRLIAEIGPEDLHRVWTAKVQGAWRLHEAAPADLDFFVMHSSAASLLGSPGQGSYAAANAALDALVTWRRAHGLTGTTINWGTWSQVGGAADLNVTVIEPISPEEGAEALEALLAFDRPSTGVLRFDAAKAVELFPEIRRMPFFEALVAAAGTAT
ncbi:MAG: SDR family NAD(P)-dependent oxidoreductase, partial [Streptosporangiaceae bacterium]